MNRNRSRVNESPKAKEKRLEKEKIKRDEINEGIERLERIVPREIQLQQQQLTAATFKKTKRNELSISRTSKAAILQSSAQYVENLRNEIDVLNQKIRELEQGKGKQASAKRNKYRKSINQLEMLMNPIDPIESPFGSDRSSSSPVLPQPTIDHPHYKLPPLESSRRKQQRGSQSGSDRDSREGSLSERKFW